MLGVRVPPGLPFQCRTVRDNGELIVIFWQVYIAKSNRWNFVDIVPISCIIPTSRGKDKHIIVYPKLVMFLFSGSYQSIIGNSPMVGYLSTGIPIPSKSREIFSNSGIFPLIVSNL